MSNFQHSINALFDNIETQLTTKLTAEDFKIHKQISSPEAFGSRYTEWRNETDKLALRLIWDGKESWFLVDESPFTATHAPKSWAEIVTVPVDQSRMTDRTYTSSVIGDVVHISRFKSTNCAE